MSKSDMVVLGFLQIKPMYGYEIIQVTKEWQLDVWAGIKMPSVYKALHRLEEQDQIRGKQILQGNNPPRKVYSPTGSGIRYFRKILKFYLKKKNILSQDFWLTISFINRSVEKDFFLDALDRRINEIQNHLSCHKKETCELESGKPDMNVPFYVKILMDVGEDIHKSELKYLKKLKSEAQKDENQAAFLTEEE